VAPLSKVLAACAAHMGHVCRLYALRVRGVCGASIPHTCPIRGAYVPHVCNTLRPLGGHMHYICTLKTAASLVIGYAR